VCAEKYRTALPPCKVLHQSMDVSGRDRVESGSRFIEKKHFRLVE
jgi:hypothetical protein